MIGFDAVVPAGTPLGEEPTPIDVLSPREAARTLAATFRAAVEGTDYYQRFFRTADPLPRGVVDGYAEVACLCRITNDERDVLEQLMFEPPADAAAADAAQRRRSVAHYLSLLADEPDVAVSDRLRGSCRRVAHRAHRRPPRPADRRRIDAGRTVRP